MRAAASPLGDGASRSDNKRYSGADYAMRSGGQSRAVLWARFRPVKSHYYFPDYIVGQYLFFSGG